MSLLKMRKVTLEEIKPGADLRYRLFTGLDLNSWDVKNINLKGSVFLGCSMIGINITDLCMVYTTFKHCNMHNAFFSDVSMFGVEFKDCDLSDADFHHIDMRYTKMEDVSLERAKMVEANLTGAKFHLVKWHNTDLRGAYLFGIKLGNVFGKPLLDNICLDKQTYKHFQKLFFDFDKERVCVLCNPKSEKFECILDIKKNDDANDSNSEDINSDTASHKITPMTCPSFD